MYTYNKSYSNAPNVASNLIKQAYDELDGFKVSKYPIASNKSMSDIDRKIFDILSNTLSNLQKSMNACKDINDLNTKTNKKYKHSNYIGLYGDDI